MISTSINVIGWVLIVRASVFVVDEIVIHKLSIFLLIVSSLLLVVLVVGDVGRFLCSSDLLLSEHLNVSVQFV